MTIAIAAAGTGGHIYPALAVADSLVTDHGVASDEIVFLGGNRMETTMVPAAGYRLEQVEIRGLRRSLSLDNLALPFVVRRAAHRMAAVMEAEGTKVVAAFGSYITIPAAMAAHRVDVPLVVHEQNAVPGLANRLAARRARATLVAFPEAAERLRGAIVVGNPLRRELTTFDRTALRATARDRYGLDPDAPVVGILGGSLGARVLNELAGRMATTNGGKLQVLHLSGRRDAERFLAESASVDTWTVVPFEPEMDRFYAAVDLVVSRAGASTISELAATETPAIVVPYALGTAGHQDANALELATAGGCVVVPEGEVDSIPPLVADLLVDDDRLAAMSAAAGSVARPDAAREVAAALVEAAGG